MGSGRSGYLESLLYLSGARAEGKLDPYEPYTWFWFRVFKGLGFKV